MKRFNAVKDKNMEKLELYVPVVKRVHGALHPEFHDVANIFDVIQGKIKTEPAKVELKKDFAELRKVTNNYTIPDDVCETYEAVYQMLAELDQALSATDAK